MKPYLPWHRLFARMLAMWKPWLALAVAAGLTVLAASFVTVKNKDTVSATVGFTFDGIDQGRNPQGNRFNADEMKNEEVIHASAQALGLSEEQEQLLQDALVITGTVPEGVFERIVNPVTIYGEDGLSSTKSMKDSTYYPTSYEIHFHYTVPGLTIHQGISFLKALLENYQSYFYRVYGYNVAFENALRTFDYSQYDYEDAVDVLSDNLSSLSEYLQWLNAQDTTHFVSSSGVSFNDLAAAVNTLRSENISQISSYISSNLMTKDMQEQINYYVYKIRDKERGLFSAQTRLETLDQLIADYTKDNALLFGSVGGESASYEITQPSPMYNQLIQEKVDCQTTISDYQESINHYQRQIDMLEDGTAGGNLTTLQEYFTILDNRMNQILDMANETATEFFETVKLENVIRILQEPEKRFLPLRIIRSSLRPGIGVEAVIFGCYLLVSIGSAFQPSQAVENGTARLPQKKKESRVMAEK